MLYCPKCNDDREKRFNQWKESVDAYISARPMDELLTMFGYSGKEGSLEDRLAGIQAFAEDRWDYRKRGGTGERWKVDDEDPIVHEHREVILRCAHELGMIERKDFGSCCDIILPLGGARRANFDRIEEAERLKREIHTDAPVIALTAMRPLGEIEIPWVKEYMTDSRAGKTTEYDVVCATMERVFGFDFCSEEGKECPDRPDEGWRIRRYDGGAVVCAPSPAPGIRRANTADTVEFFLEKFHVPERSILCFVTSSIYINYQTASLMPIALRHNLDIRFCGSSGKSGIDRNNVVSNYLQEIKASLDAIVRSLKT